MRQILLIIACLFCSNLFAQELTVKQLTALPVDLSASQYERKDLNGKACALVKVQLATTGAQFEGNVVGGTDYKTNEYWVYMTEGSYMLSIKHPSFVTLSVNFRDHGINALQSKATYRLTLLMPQTGPMNIDDGMRYLLMTVEPATATVYIDDELQLVENGTVTRLLSMGNHRYRVEAPAYEAKSGTFTLGNEKRSLPVKLESTMATLNINCATQGTQIFVNDQLRGTTSWSGTFPAGNYRIEGRLQGYRNHRQNITLAQRDRQQIDIPALQAIVGNLNVNYQPANAEVWLDGKKVGTSPDVFRNIAVGSHNIELRASGYTSKQERITIEDGKTAMLSGMLERQAVAMTTSNSTMNYSAVRTSQGESLSRHLTEIERNQMKVEYDRAYQLYSDKKYDEAFKIFKKLGDTGYQNGGLYGYLGLCYELGYGVEKNEQQALYWYDKAFEMDEGWACYRYGCILYTKGSFEKALQCFVKGKNTFWGKAALAAGQMYEKGEGTTVDINKAVEMYRLSVLQNDITSYYEYTDAYRALKRLGYPVMTEQEIASITKWNEKNSYFVGQLYEKGEGIEKNIDKAIQMYRKSAKYVFGSLEYSDAARALARLKTGMLPEQDFKNVSINTTGLSAEQLYNKGKELENKNKVDVLPRAFAYYQAAFQGGNAKATARLGKIYLEENGVYPFTDTAKGISLLERVVNSNSKACYDLGWYYKGQKDMAKAKYYFLKGTELGDDGGCPLWLAFIFEEEGNYSEALRYFELSANKNQGWAMYKAGTYYEEGKGCIKNLQTAIEWYRKSAKTNNAYAKNAQNALKKLGVD